jgi:ABC-2 type transport system permease protein
MVRSKGFIIITPLFPLLALAVFGGYQLIQQIGTQETSTEATVIGYVDEVGGFDDTSSTGEIVFHQYASLETATQALISGDIDEYFVITKDYVSTGNINRFTLERELEMPGNIRNSIRNFLLTNLFQEQIESDMLERAKAPAWFSSTRLDETGQVSPEQGGPLSVFLVPYIFSLLFWIAVLMASFTLIEGLGEEKENRIIEILLSSVSARQLVMGKIIGLGGAGLLQIAIWFISMSLIAGMASSSIGGIFSTLEIPARLIIFGLIYFILGYLLFAVLFSSIGAIVPNYREGQQLSFLIIIPGIAPLMLIYFLVNNPDHIITYLLTFFPVSIPIASIIRLAVGSIQPWQIVVNMLLLIAAIMGVFFLGTKIFRTFLLMYGKRPSLREIARSLRRA